MFLYSKIWLFFLVEFVFFSCLCIQHHVCDLLLLPKIDIFEIYSEHFANVTAQFNLRDKYLCIFLNRRLYHCDTVDPFLFSISYDICIELLHFNNTIKIVDSSDLVSLLNFKVTKIHSSVLFYVP